MTSRGGSSSLASIDGFDDGNTGKFGREGDGEGDVGLDRPKIQLAVLGNSRTKGNRRNTKRFSLMVNASILEEVTWKSTGTLLSTPILFKSSCRFEDCALLMEMIHPFGGDFFNDDAFESNQSNIQSTPFSFQNNSIILRAFRILWVESISEPEVAQVSKKIRRAFSALY